MARAAKGGQFGANGEFYEGGKFIATTDRPKGSPKPKPVYTGPRRVMTTPHTWEDNRASEGLYAIYTMYCGTDTYVDRSGVMHVNTVAGYSSRDAKAMYHGHDFGTIGELVDAYNAGTRWVSPR